MHRMTVPITPSCMLDPHASQLCNGIEKVKGDQNLIYVTKPSAKSRWIFGVFIWRDQKTDLL